MIQLSDIRGDLQMHSDWSDGKTPMEEMLEGCVARGYEYFALTDHSKALAMTRGMDAEKLKQQFVEIDKVRERHPEIRFLRSMEIDILAGGELDLEDEMIEQLDIALVSVHSRFQLPRAEQTKPIGLISRIRRSSAAFASTIERPQFRIASPYSRARSANIMEGAEGWTER